MFTCYKNGNLATLIATAPLYLSPTSSQLIKVCQNRLRSLTLDPQLLGRDPPQRAAEGRVHVGHHPRRPARPRGLRYRGHLLQVTFKKA
jgi:hypothetical protein